MPDSGDKRPALAAEPLLLRAVEAAHLCGVSLRQWRRWDASGRGPAAVRIAATKRWRRGEILEWIGASCPPRKEWEDRSRPGA